MPVWGSPRLFRKPKCLHTRSQNDFREWPELSARDFRTHSRLSASDRTFFAGIRLEVFMPGG